VLSALFKRSSIYLGGLTVSKLLSTLVFILFARILLPQNFGNFVLFVTLLQVVTFFADFGLIQWYQKQATITDKNTLIGEVLFARLITLFISIIISIFFLLISKSFSNYISILFIISLVPEAFLSVIDGYYLELKQSFRVSLKTTVRMVLIFAGYLVFYNAFSFVSAIKLYLLSSIITLLWYFPWLKFKYFSSSNFSKSFQTLNSSKLYAFLIFTSFTYSRGDSLVVRYTLNSTALGLYAAAYRFLESLSLIPTALAHNLFPISAKEGNVIKSQLMKIVLIMSLLGLVTAFLVFIFSSRLITFILGNAYSAAIPLLKVFSLVIFLFFINSPLNTIVLSSSQINKFLTYGVGNTLLNIALNIIFVPLFGVTAAAWVMLTTEITGFVINVYFARQVYS